MRKIERLRADHPMWGKRKLAVLLRREGIDVSVSMVGRILTKLMARGVVTPVPMLRRKPGPRRLRIMGQRHAKRLASRVAVEVEVGEELVRLCLRALSENPTRSPGDAIQSLISQGRRANDNLAVTEGERPALRQQDG